MTPMLDPVPNKTSITKLVKGKKALTVKWKKSNEIIRGKHITGYQIRYSLNSGMKNSKSVTVKGYKNISKKLTKLKGGKRYYAQLRTYYAVGTKKYVSGWSAKKSMKTKK